MKRLARGPAVVAAFVLCLSVAVVGGVPQMPQTAVQRPDQTLTDQPEDFRAFNDASRTSDPRRRIEALQKFMADYPDSMLVSMARSEIFDQLANSIAQAGRTLQAEIEKAIESGRGTLYAYDTTVGKLLRAGIMLDEAERLGEKGLAANTDPQKYIDDLRASRNRLAASSPGKGTQSGGLSWNMSGPRVVRWIPPRPGQPATPAPEPSDAELRAQFRALRGRLQNTLAEVYLKRARPADAERLFREVYANADVSPLVKEQAVRELAAFARQAGDEKALLQYLLDSVTFGAPPATHAELRALYGKLNGGSLDGLDATLEERSAKALPKIEVKPFERPRTRNSRMVLAELFTGSECKPCVGVDLAIEVALKRYPREDLALLVYHEHVPGPDPMANPATENRAQFYGVIGGPMCYVDGKSYPMAGRSADEAEPLLADRLAPAIEKELESRSGAALDVKVVPAGSTIKVTASAAKLASDSPRLRLHLALAEERVRYQGGNGLRYHTMVVRAMAGDGSGFALVSGKATTVEWNVDIAKIVADNAKYIDAFLSKPFREGPDKPALNGRVDEIDRNQLVIVAFVQDEDPKQGSGETLGAAGRTLQREAPLRSVLQAACVKVPRVRKGTL